MRQRKNTDSLTPFRRRARIRRLIRRGRWLLGIIVCLALMAGTTFWSVSQSKVPIVMSMLNSASATSLSIGPTTTVTAFVPTRIRPITAAPVSMATHPSLTPVLPTSRPTREPTVVTTLVPVAALLAHEAATPLLVVLDASNSMRAQLDGATRIDVARETLAGLLQTLPTTSSVQLWAYGTFGDTTHQGKALSCVAGQALTGLEAPQVAQKALLLVHPRGWTPLAATLDAIAVRYPAGPLRVVLLTDGVETCGGTPTAAAARLHAGDSQRQLIVVGLNIDEEGLTALHEIAHAGGGALITATDPASLHAAVLGP